MTPPTRPRIAIPIAHASQGDPVPIVADGSVASAGIGQGRHIPVLILDTSHRHDVETMVRAHQDIGPGDATSYWTINKRRFALDSPRLLLQTTKPSECVVIIDFDMTKNQGSLVDLILWARGVYLQPGRPGDRLATAFDNPKILVEIPPNEEFQKPFQLLYEKAIFRRFKKKGMSRARAKWCARAFFKESRGFFQKPIPF